MSFSKLSISEAYEILGLPNGVAMPDIKKRYRALAKEWHPDSCSKPNAEQKFARIAMAYERLVEWERNGRPDPSSALFFKLRKNAEEEEKAKKAKEARRMELIRKIRLRNMRRDREQARQYKLAIAIVLTLALFYFGGMEVMHEYREYQIRANPGEAIATIIGQESYVVHYEFEVNGFTYHSSERVEFSLSHNRAKNGLPIRLYDGFVVRYNQDDPEYHAIDFFRPTAPTFQRYVDEVRSHILHLFPSAFIGLDRLEREEVATCIAHQTVENLGYDGMADLIFAEASYIENSVHNAMSFDDLCENPTFQQCFTLCGAKLPVEMKE